MPGLVLRKSGHMDVEAMTHVHQACSLCYVSRGLLLRRILRRWFVLSEKLAAPLLQCVPVQSRCTSPFRDCESCLPVRAQDGSCFHPEKGDFCCSTQKTETRMDHNETHFLGWGQRWAEMQKGACRMSTQQAEPEACSN